MLSTTQRSAVVRRPTEPGPLVSVERGRTVIWLDGEHDLSTVHVVAAALAEVIARDDADVLVDLSGVTFLGVVAIDVLDRSREILERRARTLRLRGLSAVTTRVLGICGLEHLVDPTDATARLSA